MRRRLHRSRALIFRQPLRLLAHGIAGILLCCDFAREPAKAISQAHNYKQKTDKQPRNYIETAIITYKDLYLGIIIDTYDIYIDAASPWAVDKSFFWHFPETFSFSPKGTRVTFISCVVCVRLHFSHCTQCGPGGAEAPRTVRIDTCSTPDRTCAFISCSTYAHAL